MKNSRARAQVDKTGDHLFGRGPLGLQLVLVEALLEQPAQAGHALHPVEEGRVLGRVLVTLHHNSHVSLQAALPAGLEGGGGGGGGESEHRLGGCVMGQVEPDQPSVVSTLMWDMSCYTSQSTGN